MSMTVGTQVTAVPAAIRQAKQQCAACGRSKSIAAFARTRSGGRHHTCATCMRKASAARAARREVAPRTGPADGTGATTANTTLVGSVSAVWGVPTATDVALEARIAGIAAALREALRSRGTLVRDWKIGQLQLALIAAVRMRSAAQIVRLMMRTGTVAAAAGPEDQS